MFYMDKFNNINQIINNINNIIINYIQKNNNLVIEGNYGSFEYNNNEINEYLRKKIDNLLWAMNLLKNNPTVCEIGFNTGFSSSMMMLGLYNKNPNYYIFDYGEHIYINSCLELFKNTFENKINKFEYTKGNSIITVPNFINNNQNLIGTFDFIHIDGGHTEECITNDFKNCDVLIKKPGGIIIIDDTNISYINELVDFYIKNNNYVELFFLDVSNFIYPHRIIQKK